VKFDPPPAEIAARLVQRPDDTEEVLVKRLTEYHSKTAPLIPYYQGKGALVSVDGVGPVDEIKKRILKALGL
jgi:adenylate kinase